MNPYRSLQKAHCAPERAGRWPAALSALFFWICSPLPVQAGEIHDAAAAGDLAKVRSLLDADPTLLESRGNMGWRPLHSVCFAPPSFNPQVREQTSSTTP